MLKSNKLLYFQFIFQWVTFLIIGFMIQENESYQEFQTYTALLLHSFGYFFYIFKFLFEFTNKILKKDFRIPEDIQKRLFILIQVNYWGCFLWYFICIIFTIYFPPLHFFASSFQFVFFFNNEQKNQGGASNGNKNK